MLHSVDRLLHPVDRLLDPVDRMGQPMRYRDFFGADTGGAAMVTSVAVAGAGSPKLAA
jgi:hypothetical protein